MLSKENVLALYKELGVSKGDKVAIAVSGGADSLCLLFVSIGLFDITVLTVDHGLREDSAKEAAWVAECCKAKNIPHVTLRWEGKKPTSNIQAEARDARYALMKQWCRANGVAYIATAHHLDDQAETVMLRLARGSGVYGLAGMAAVRDLRDGISLVRPLLTITKKHLTDTLDRLNQHWIEDPSNQSQAYDRVRIRKFLQNPPVEGLSPERIAATADRMRRSREALEHYEGKWLDASAVFHEQGYVILKLSCLSSEPEEIVLRGVASLCRHVSGGRYVPRMEKLVRLKDALMQEGFRGHTLYGVKFSPSVGGGVLITREMAAVGAAADLARSIIWDKRFAIASKGDISGLKVTVLGEKGWAKLKADMPNFNKNDIPRLAGLVLPAIFEGLNLRAVPHLGYNTLENVELTVSLNSEILTKK